MTNASTSIGARVASVGTTDVELALDNRIEHWIRFGHPVAKRVSDSRRQFVSFAPGSIFSLISWWTSNSFAALTSRIDIVRAVTPGERFEALPFINPGGEILLQIGGLPGVACVLQAISAVENLCIDPASVASCYWRLLHARVLTGEIPSRYNPHDWLSNIRLAGARSQEYPESNTSEDKALGLPLALLEWL